MVQKVDQDEILVLLLIGHGNIKYGKFQFLIITEPDKIKGEAVITKRDLENALNSCKGNVPFICNSCYSGHLVSYHWTLLCSATIICTDAVRVGVCEKIGFHSVPGGISC